VTPPANRQFAGLAHSPAGVDIIGGQGIGDDLTDWGILSENPLDTSSMAIRSILNGLSASTPGYIYHFDDGSQLYVMGGPTTGALAEVGSLVGPLAFRKFIKFPKPAVTKTALETASDTAFEAAKRVDDFVIPKKHLPGAGGNWSRFAEGIDAKAAIKEGLQSDAARFLPNNKPGSFKVEVPLGRAVGSNGEEALRIIIGEDGKIWTAFPINL
jgi:hypothetical protein